MHPAVLELKSRLQDKFGDHLKRFIVFGSYIRGDNTPESDIDVFVTFDKEIDWKFKKEVLKISFDVELEYEVVLDVKMYSEYEILHTIAGATPFVENVFREGVAV